MHAWRGSPLLHLIAAAMLCTSTGMLNAEPHPGEQPPLSQAAMRVAPDPIRPGHSIPIALLFTMEPGWHTYAEEPGDSGMPPTIVLETPADVRIDPWRFPPPQRFTDTAGTTFGYEHRVVLLSTIHLPDTLEPGDTLELRFLIDWMVCNEICVPLSQVVTMTLLVGTSPDTPASAQHQNDWHCFLKTGGWSAHMTQTPTGATPAKERP